MTEISKFQEAASDWALRCFGTKIVRDKTERIDRFLEEALELAQSLGYDRERAQEMVGYVFGRPKGEPAQEFGGVMMTLAVLADVHCFCLEGAAIAELDRVDNPDVITEIRKKQAGKPKVGNAVTEWQPIDTAPMGKTIWVWAEAWDDHWQAAWGEKRIKATLLWDSFDGNDFPLWALDETSPLQLGASETQELGYEGDEALMPTRWKPLEGA